MTFRQRRLPPLHDILDDAVPDIDKAEVQEQIRLIEKTLADFDFPAEVRDVHHGPRMTQFGLKPRADVASEKIKTLDQDLAVALSGALAEIALPTPSYPYLRIAVENYHQPNVKLRQVLGSTAFNQREGALKIGLGLDIFGQPVIIDLAALPHLLIGGTTGSGKSVCINAIIASLVCTYLPDTLRLVLIDPIRVELTKFNDLPHLMGPLVTRSGQVLEVFNRIVQEIEQRYTRFTQVQVRDIAGYNQRAAQAGGEKLPYLVIIVDNLFDLMTKAPADLEQLLTRIAQKARAAGVHLVLATVRTHTDILSGSIKANFPGRIALKVVNKAESQLILDSAGAEDLLGHGDMLYKSPETSRLQRVQGVYVSEAELDRLIEFWRNA
jgi:S-DNA-T family DNA segregation ATPase FtsK/SpoIIIE